MASAVSEISFFDCLAVLLVALDFVFVDALALVEVVLEAFDFGVVDSVGCALITAFSALYERVTRF